MQFNLQFLYIFAHISLYFAQSPLDFVITSPKQGDLFLIQPDKTSADLTVNYAFNDINAVSSICYQINSDVDNTEILQETCFPQGMQSVTFTDMTPNKYKLSAVTTGINPGEIGPIIQRSFEIQSIVNLTPKLKILNDKFTFACDEGVDQATVSLRYNITDNRIPQSNFLICGRLVTMPDGNTLADTSCFNTNETTISMDLPIGYYQLQMFFQEKFTNTYLESGSKMLITFEVGTFQDMLPDFRVVQKSLDMVIDPATNTSIAVIPYLLEGIVESFNKIQICIEVIDLDTQKLFVSLSCINYSEPKNIALQGIPEGLYKANLILRNKQNPDLIYGKSLNVIQMEARSPREFIPSYEWQPLKQWHTIPYGLETRLPLSINGGNKEAKIPAVWRLQLSLPDICHSNSGLYFLRVEVDRRITLTQIR